MGESDSTICGQASKEPRPRGTGHSPTSLWDEPGVLFCIGVALRRLIFQCCIHPQGRTLGHSATITVKNRVPKITKLSISKTLIG